MTENTFRKIDMENYNPEDKIFITTLYLSESGSSVDISNERLLVTKNDIVIFSLPCIKFKQVVILAKLNLLPNFISYCLEKEIPVVFLSSNGYYKGRLLSNGFHEVRALQYQLAYNNEAKNVLRTSKAFIAGKIRNYSHFIKNTFPLYNSEAEKLLLMSNELYKSKSLEELRGFEGSAAAMYFSIIKNEFEHLGFTKRVKRPPTDMINGLLSFGYTILYSNIISILLINHLNPYIGIFHVLDQTHASLASDLMEEFRAYAVDRVVFSLMKTNTFTKEDFFITETGGYYLQSQAKRKFISCLEKSFNEIFLHPETNFKVSLKKLIDLQSKQLYRVIKREDKDYIPMLFEKEG
ncbi:MAG: CRISPR-associated endonuclease Cas1 [Candidatus Sericytochromatia bacterium]